MRLRQVALILAVLAGPAAAEVIALEGDMTKMRIAEGPALGGEAILPSGAAAPLAEDFGARLTVLNFWATWCAPCRHEMPTLDALAADPPEGVAVIALSTGRDAPERIAAFWAEAGLSALADRRDPSGAIGRAAAVRGLPTTLILDARGREVARLTGTADWNAPEARAALEQIAATYTLR